MEIRRLFFLLALLATTGWAAPAKAQALYDTETLQFQAPRVPESITFAGKTYRIAIP